VGYTYRIREPGCQCPVRASFFANRIITLAGILCRRPLTSPHWQNLDGHWISSTFLIIWSVYYNVAQCVLSPFQIHLGSCLRLTPKWVTLSDERRTDRRRALSLRKLSFLRSYLCMWVGTEWQLVPVLFPIRAVSFVTITLCIMRPTRLLSVVERLTAGEKAKRAQSIDLTRRRSAVGGLPARRLPTIKLSLAHWPSHVTYDVRPRTPARPGEI